MPALGSLEPIEADEPRERRQRKPRLRNPNIGRRVRAISRRTTEVLPETSMRLVAQSPMPNGKIERAATVLDKAVNYVESANTFAGIPGQLMAARQRAIGIPDPLVRQQALDILEAVGGMTPDQQSTIMSVIQNPGQPMTPEQTDAFELAIAGAGGEVLTPTPPIRGRDPVTGVVLAGENASISTAAALSALFPELETYLSPDLYEQQAYEESIQYIGDTAADWMYQSANVQAGVETLADLDKRVAEEGWSVGAALQFASAGGQITAGTAPKLAGEALRETPGGTIVANFFGTQAHAAEEKMSEAIMPLMTRGMTPVGNDANGNPVYSLEDQRRIQERGGAFLLIGGALGFAGGSVLGRMARRTKVARTSLGKDAAAAALESTRSVHRTGILGEVAETYRAPVRFVTRKFDEAIVRFARNPDEFFAGGIGNRQGKRLLATMDEAKRLSPDNLDEQVGFVREAYKTAGPGSLNGRLIRTMLQENTHAGMKRIFVETVTNKPGMRVIKEATTRLRGIQEKLRRIEDPAFVAGQEREMVRLARDMNELRTEWNSAKSSGATGADVDQMAVELRSMAERIKTIGAELDSVPRLRLAAAAEDWTLKTTFDDSPMLVFPKRNAVRAMVRAPVSKSQKLMHLLTAKNAKILDPAKFVDELPRYPDLHVQGHPDAPVNAVDVNTTIISTYLRRAGVDPKTIRRRIGELQNIDNQQAFYALLEKKIFGTGGDIDTALSRHKNLDPTLRKRLITLHDNSIESRSMTNIGETTQGRYGKLVARRPVLGREVAPGEFTPLPSRPTEFMSSLRLPDVDLLIEADSFMRRGLSQMQRSGKVGSALTMVHRLPNFVLRASTLTMKPLVMLVRLPAMIMRIQMEQALRMGSLGYKPIGGLPNGLSLMPGGIPIPMTKMRVLSGLFGKDGWKMLDPDPRMKGFADPESTDIGVFASELMDEGPTELTPESTLDFRSGASERTPQSQHYEGWRNELEQAHADQITRKLAQLGLNTEQMRDWIDNNPWAKNYMETLQGPVLREAYPDMAPEPELSPRQYVERYIDADSGESNNYTHAQLKSRIRAAQTFRGRGTLLENGVRRHTKEDGTRWYTTEDADGTITSYRTVKRDGRVDAVTDPDLQGQGYGSASLKAHWADEGVYDAPDPYARAQELIAQQKFSRQGAELNIKELNRLGSERPEVAPVAPFDRVDRWLEDQAEYLRQLTKNDPAVLEAIATGQKRTSPRLDTDTLPDGRKVVGVYDDALDKLAAIQDSIRMHERGGTPEDIAANAAVASPEMVALQLERKIVKQKLADLKREFPDVEVKTVRLADKRRFRAHLKDEWDNSRIEMPDRLMIQKRVRAKQSEGGALSDPETYFRGVNNAMYRPFKALSYIDKKGTRGSLFTQAYKRELSKLEARGYDTDTAKAIAYARAGELTKDIMYDLSARTSAQRAFKDLFWFAPAMQEVLYTWAVKIPSESYWPIGVGSLALKTAGVIDILTALGVVEKDADGERIIKLPGPGGLYSYGKLGGLNLVTTGGGVPGLSTAGNFGVGQAALKWGGPFKDLSDFFQPYGPETSILPQPITFLHEAVFGQAPPWEFAAPEYLKAGWDRTVDMGLQYAFADLGKRGIKPPRPEDFGTKQSDGTWELSPENEAEYKAASKLFLDQLMPLGEEYAKEQAWVRFMGSTVTPMSLYTSSNEREEWENFWTNVVAPEGFGTTGLSETQHAAVDSYLDRFPNSMAYSVFYSGYGEKVRDLPFKEELDDKFFDEFYTGERVTLEPDQYRDKLLAMESRRFYQNQLDTELDKVDPARDPWVMLRSGHERKSAMSAYNESWNRYLMLNPQQDALLKSQSAYWIANNKVPVRSFEAERLGDTIAYIDQLAPMFLGESGMKPTEVAYVQSQLKAAFAENGTFGAPNTPTEKAMGWWFETVMDPYIEKTGDLYLEADQLQANGLDAGDVYNQIRQLSDAPAPMYKGQPVPSVEEVFFGNRSPEQKAAAVNTWASRPLSWLSAFQLEQVGYGSTPEVQEYLNQVAVYDETFYDYIKTEGIASGSDRYNSLQATRDQTLMANAQAIGPEAVAALQLNEAQPYVRLTEVGFGSNSSSWVGATGAAGSIIDALEAEELSPKGFSERAVDMKVQLYTNLVAARASDPAFDELWEGLEDSFPLPGGGYRQGAALYEAVLFGNFNVTYMDYSVAQAGFDPNP